MNMNIFVAICQSNRKLLNKINYFKGKESYKKYNFKLLKLLHKEILEFYLIIQVIINLIYAI